MTTKEFEQLKPCKEGLVWALTQPSLTIAWDTCDRSGWMWWLLKKLDKTPKELSVNFARWCAEEAQQYKNASYASAYAAAAAAAYALERKKQANYLRTLVPNPFLVATSGENKPS